MGMNIMRMKGRAKMMRTIKVTGKGKIAVKPDKIRLYVNKEELCKEYEDTLRRSTEDTELLKDLFEKLGFQRKDLKTVYFNVDLRRVSSYSWQSSSLFTYNRIISGFTAIFPFPVTLIVLIIFALPFILIMFIPID